MTELDFNQLTRLFSCFLGPSLVLFGLVIGSFLNVCIYRIPRHSFFASSRSLCVHCGTQIPAWNNIPILSFLVLRGRARCCQRRIPWRYPLVEILAAIAFVGIYLKFPFMGFADSMVFHQPTAIRYAHALSFTLLLGICSFIDIDLRIIPDIISLPMIALSPFVVMLHPELNWSSSLLGVVIGGTSVILINRIYSLIRNATGIGMGDAKLLAAIGGWLGYQAIFPTFFFGSILGSIFGVAMMLMTRQVNLRAEIPFGPFLAVGSLLHLFLSSRITEKLFHF